MKQINVSKTKLPKRSFELFIFILSLPLLIWFVYQKYPLRFETAKAAMPTSVSSSTQSIQVLQPNGGETLSPNQTYPVQWTSTGVETVAIDIVDKYGNFSTIALPMSASAGQFMWTTPSSWYGTSNQFVVKVYEYPGQAIYDTSDAFFSISLAYHTPTPTISPTPTIPPRVLTITYPNGGEKLVPGQTVRITWNSAYIDTVQIDRVNYDGSANGVSGGIPNTGFFDWLVPKPPGLYDLQTKIRINGRTNGVSSSIMDFSDGYFSILQPTPSPTQTPTPISCSKADINKDGAVNQMDLNVLMPNFLTTGTISPARADINGDGVVDVLDYSFVASHFNEQTGACL